MNSATCRSCHRPVIWVITENDRSMPVDAEPVEDGNVLLTGETNRFGAPLAS